MNASELPLVSVIVQSTGKPEVALSLASVARQDYPSVETIVVDATAGGHRPLPLFNVPQGHVVRVLGGDRILKRAQAANVGMLAARGEWLCFLDENGTYDRDFVSAMVKAAGQQPEVLVVYGRTRILRADGQIVRAFGRPFNRLLVHYRPLFYRQAALVRCRVVELGCRFDEALEIFEDRDFFAQIAEHAALAFVPVTGSTYRASVAGSDNTRRDIARVTRFESLLRAKWSGPCAYHARRAGRLNERAAAAFRDGNRRRSRELFEALLGEYPDDPNGLHGLALIELDEGRPENAESFVMRAVDLNPSAGEYRLTWAAILGRLGRHQDARREAMLAARTPALRSSAENLLRQLNPADAADVAKEVAIRSKSSAVSRLDPCACGSGKSYGECCGSTATESAASDVDRVAHEARALFLRGEALRAKTLIDSLAPVDIADPELSQSAGEICIASGCLEQAYGFLDRSARLAPSARTAKLLSRCCDLLWMDCARASSHALVLHVRQGIEKRAMPERSPTHGPIHVLGTLGTIGGSETRAISLYRVLSAHADVRLWSASPPLAGHYAGLPIRVLDPARDELPSEGTLILAGHYFDPGDWWRRVSFDRIVICVNLDLPLRLVRLLTDIEESPSAARIEFTFPSRLARDIFGLPGRIEYSFADISRFARAAPARHAGKGLAIGRHSRDDRSKHHPNDPALYRELVARGHRLRLLGGTCLQSAFSEDSDVSAIEMLPTGGEDPREFLEGLDCFIYRKHPHFLETGGTAILEAMAMALPVVLFRGGVGAAEIIEHGQDGFLVDTEAEALACIDRLAADPRLRAAVGSAARRKVTAVMREQQERILSYYLGSG